MCVYLCVCIFLYLTHLIQCILCLLGFEIFVICFVTSSPSVAQADLELPLPCKSWNYNCTMPSLSDSRTIWYKNGEEHQARQDSLGFIAEVTFRRELSVCVRGM